MSLYRVSCLCCDGAVYRVKPDASGRACPDCKDRGGLKVEQVADGQRVASVTPAGLDVVWDWHNSRWIAA